MVSTTPAVSKWRSCPYQAGSRSRSQGCCSKSQASSTPAARMSGPSTGPVNRAAQAIREGATLKLSRAPPRGASVNMMMGLNEFSANDVINKLNKEDIEKILKFFGDEKDAKIISKNIIKFREHKHINTEDLVNIIERSKRKKNFKVHSATKSFQALRIFVNKEIVN